MLSVGSFEIVFSPTISGNLQNIIMHNIISANQNNKSFVYRWLCAIATFDITFQAFC